MGSKKKAMSSGTSVGIARHDSQQDDFTTQQPPSKRRRGNPPKDKVIGKGGLLTPSSPSSLESASISLCEPKLTSVHEPKSVHQAINSEEEKNVPLLRARIPYKAKKIMPEAWKKYLIPLFEDKCSEERAKRLQPFRLGIAYGRLTPLTNCAHGTAENTLEGVDINRPIIWTKKDHVHDNVKDIREALENAFFCTYKEPQGQRYQAGHARVEVYDTSNNPVNRSIMQAYNDPTRSPLYYVINVPIPEYVFSVCEMLARREHIYSEDDDPKSHYGGTYTPEGVCVDIHIDHGGRGSTWHGEGPKLWAFYPPTSKNIELLCRHLQ